MAKHNDNSVEDKILQQDEALNSLGIVMGEIANDFNNILSLIFGYVEMALSEIPEGQRARSDLEHVLATGDRAKELVARILTFSHQNKLKHSQIPLEKPIVAAIAAFQKKLPSNITLESSIECKNEHVLGNSTEIFQVVTNLLSNSVQAIYQDAGHITVSLKCDKAHHQEGERTAILTVTDNGCGMDLETLSNIYTPFFSSNANTKSNEKRAGLGMVTVFNIVNNMNGQISVDSTPDLGTTVEISFPLLSAESTEDQDQESPEQSEEQKHVLFIDDEQAITAMAEQMLTKCGFKVSTFVDGNKAIEHFKNNPHEYDVVITDLVMPNISGTELSLQLGKVMPNIPIILTTGFSEKISSSSCQKWGISLVINKPFSMKDLVSAIETIT